MRTILDELDKVDRWAAANQVEAAKLLASTIGLPLSVMESSLSHTGFGVRPLTPDVVADQQKIADTFTSLGLIPNRLDVASVIWNQTS